MSNPQKSQTLHVESLGAELSVYDWQRLQMHSLNPTAAKVFELCDGQTSPAQMAKRLDAPEALVWQSLDELGKASLLQEPITKPASYQNMTRQQFLKLGSAVALASIVSIVVPRPAAAASPGAATGGGGGYAGPITRTVTVGTLPGDSLNWFAFTTPITAAELIGITTMTISWTGSDPIGGNDITFRLRQSSGGLFANSMFYIQSVPPGLSGSQSSTDTDDWTGNRPYNGFTLYRLTSWAAGDLTITFV